MSVKFKLGFTVSAETLFTLLSKMLPIDDLSVEEVVEPPRASAYGLAGPVHETAQTHQATTQDSTQTWEKRA